MWYKAWIPNKEPVNQDKSVKSLPFFNPSSPVTSWQIVGETAETVADFIFWAPQSLQMVTATMKLEDAYSLEVKLWPT